MPDLVSLHLKHCLPLPTDDTPQPKSVIILNQLRSIVIADDSELCAWFLDAVEMAPTSARMFCYNNLASALVLYRACADYLSRATTPLLGVDLKACTRERSGLYEYVSDDEDNSFVIVLKVLSDSHARKGPPFMDIHMALAFDPHEDVNAERAFLKIIAAIRRPLQPIHILTCNITPYIKVSDEFWLELDRCFPNLIVLSLTPADMRF
ncbi:hypothetical protein ONZ45_g6028 [Pleurotus djamor]|nr:hypothetical protein ONZ45_g6028 [Pleurotus djamor]